MSETKKTSPQRMWIAISLSLLVSVILYLSWAEDSIDVQQKDEEPIAQPVSIEHLSVSPETVEVSAFAEVRPRWSAEIRAAVSGRVVEVRDSALAGEKVEAGTVLISIENSPYAAEVAAAELALKEAKFALSKAEKHTAIARKQFKQEGMKPANDLALHLPQLRIAKSALKSAETRLEASRQQLQDTTVTAPFSGYIVERYISPGQTVNIGDALVKLVDNRQYELVAEVGKADWLLIQQPLSGQTAKVLDQNATPITQAAIRQSGGFLDETTRQYKVFMEIPHADQAPVLSGEFVRVLLPGITVPKALRISASALTQEGYLWYLDDNDRLQRTTPQVLFRQQDRVIIRAPEGIDSWHIVTTPLVAFLPGKQVRPLPAAE